MTTWQRRRSTRFASFYPRRLLTTDRGDEQWEVNWEGTPIRVAYSGQADRSSRAEVPGQLLIDERHIQVSHDKVPADYAQVWGGVELSDEPGVRWDITQPPTLAWGTGHVRHWTVVLRRRGLN